MKEIDHPGVCKIYEYFEDENFFFIIMDLMQGGDLFEYIKANGKLEEKVARAIIREVLGAINFLHYKGVVHRDIKPENIMFQETDHCVCSLHLVDFGLSCYLDQGLFLGEK